MEKLIDTARPFIAIREDVKGTKFEPTMGEYLCNPLGEDLLDAEVSPDGFDSDNKIDVIPSDDDVIASDESDNESFTVPAGRAVRFALSTWDEYGETVCHWSLRYHTLTSDVTIASFDTFRRLANTRSFSDLPVLGGPGVVIPRS